MSPSEIGFLALGLVLGIAVGATLLAVVRVRPPLRPVVRVTITPNAMTPRDGALAGRSRVSRLDIPAPGSPDEQARLDLADGLPVGASTTGANALPRLPEIRTRVPSDPGAVADGPVAIPIMGGGQPAARPAASSATAVAVAERPAQAPDPVSSARLGLHARIEVGRSRTELAVRPRPPVPEVRPTLVAGSLAIPVVAVRGRPGGSHKSAGTPGRPATSAPASDPCADDRAQASVACAEADATREVARSLADRLRDAQRGHADLQARVEEAAALADPRRLGAEKERLHAQFRAADSATTTAEEAEDAAREWLTAVSDANAAARDAAHRARSGSDELRVQAVALERLDLEANAARISSERAEAACRAARETLATCEERQRSVAPTRPDDQDPNDVHWPGGPVPGLDRRPAGPVDLERPPVILRVLRGDTAAREQLVAGLAQGDPSATAAWHVRIAKFVDAITARAIEDGYLDLPGDHPFWHLFSDDEQREIVLALSALGFRFDGMRGFTDDRAPSARDLSLAVGYAGLDRMRIRTWPGEGALASLFDGAIVRGDLWLAYQADDLSLTRVEAALGARAGALGELWDAWGRARPAMLDES